MPIYMDRHDIEGITAFDVAEAHKKDLKLQDKYGCKALTYWFDEANGTTFCLIEAPHKDALVQMHNEAHGDVPNNIIEVAPETVNAFLGRIEDPKPATSSGEITINESAFRIIMFTDMEGSTTITTQLGDEKSMELLRAHDAIIRNAIKNHGGSEVKHPGDGFMISFSSVSNAVECAITIQRDFNSFNNEDPDIPLHIRIGLSAGEPVTEGGDLFGSTVQLAARICDHAEPKQILVTSVIQKLCIGKKLPFTNLGEITFKGFEEPEMLHEVNWQAV